jgi:hypothetical protein
VRREGEDSQTGVARRRVAQDDERWSGAAVGSAQVARVNPGSGSRLQSG